jgi:hypothetical protein
MCVALISTVDRLPLLYLLYQRFYQNFYLTQILIPRSREKFYPLKSSAIDQLEHPDFIKQRLRIFGNLLNFLCVAKEYTDTLGADGKKFDDILHQLHM